MSRRALRRHRTAVKHERKAKLRTAIGYADPGDHKPWRGKFWPMRCNCDWCVNSRTRKQRADA